MSVKNLSHRSPNVNKNWVNIADHGDIVEKYLRVRFGDQVDNRMVYNDATAHDVTA